MLLEPPWPKSLWKKDRARPGDLDLERELCLSAGARRPGLG